MLADLWMLGHQLMMPKMQKDAMCRMLDITEHRITDIQEMDRMYGIAPTGSKLKELSIQEALWRYVRGDWVAEELVGYGPDYNGGRTYLLVEAIDLVAENARHGEVHMGESGRHLFMVQDST